MRCSPKNRYGGSLGLVGGRNERLAMRQLSLDMPLRQPLPSHAWIVLERSSDGRYLDLRSTCDFLMPQPQPQGEEITDRLSSRGIATERSTSIRHLQRLSPAAPRSDGYPRATCGRRDACLAASAASWLTWC